MPIPKCKIVQTDTLIVDEPQTFIRGLSLLDNEDDNDCQCVTYTLDVNRYYDTVLQESYLVNTYQNVYLHSI
jgi:hypothetical protein